MLQLITFKWNTPEIPTIEQVRNKLGLSLISIDYDFGIKVKDTSERLFTILADDIILKKYKDNILLLNLPH